MSISVAGNLAKNTLIRYSGKVPESLKRALAPYADRVDEVIKGSRKNGDDWTYCAYYREGWHDHDDASFFSAFASTGRALVSAVKKAGFSDPLVDGKTRENQGVSS